MRIELTPEVESALESAARRQGTTPSLLAEAYLRERLEVAPSEVPGHERETLADFLAGYIGVLGDEGEPEGSLPGGEAGASHRVSVAAAGAISPAA